MRVFFNKNILFLFAILIFHWIFCYSHALSLQRYDKFLQLYAELSNNQTNTTNTTNVTGEIRGTPNMNSSAPSTNISEIASNATREAKIQNTTLQNTNSTKTNQQNKTEGNSKFKETLDQNNQKLNDLENTVKDQAKILDDAKLLVKDIANLSKQINETQKSTEKIMSSIGDLKDFYKQLDYKITSNSIEMDNKLNIINSKLVDQLRNQLTAQLFNLEKDISTLEEEVKKINMKIKEIKSQLPNLDSACSLLTSCVSCTTNPSCGWCSMTQQCVEGDIKGPKDGSCTFYDYNVCSGPRECDSYNTCDSCIKDVSCGWCSNSGNPVCMSKEDADKNKCSEDRFVHLWRGLNVCPHVNIDNFKGVTLQALKENEMVTTPPYNPLEMNPEVKKRLIEQLKVYMNEKNTKEILLLKYLKVSNQTQQQMKNLESDSLQFNLIDRMHQNQKDKFYDISSSLFDLLKDYLMSFTKQSVNSKLTQENKISNSTVPLEGNLTNIGLPVNLTQSVSSITNTTTNTTNQTSSVSSIANTTTNKTNQTSSVSSITNTTTNTTNQTSSVSSIANTTTNTTNQTSSVSSIANTTTNQTKTETPTNNQTQLKTNITSNQTPSETPNTNATNNQTVPLLGNTTTTTQSNSESLTTNATINQTTKPEAPATNATSNQTNQEVAMSKTIKVETTNSTTDNVNSTVSKDQANKVKGINKMKNPTKAQESDEVVKNDKTQLIQIAAEFGVDPNTFMTSFIQKESNHPKEFSNLRYQSKIIFL